MARAPETRPSLLVRLRDRSDGPAWRQFVEVYAPLIYGVARRQGLQDADVDLVGPGAAYERWQKTPEYQEWRRKTADFVSGK